MYSRKKWGMHNTPISAFFRASPVTYSQMLNVEIKAGNTLKIHLSANKVEFVLSCFIEIMSYLGIIIVYVSNMYNNEENKSYV